MGKIIQAFTTKYEAGDVVIFQRDRKILCGIIEGHYVVDDYLYFNIRLWKDNVLTYSNGGAAANTTLSGRSKMVWLIRAGKELLESMTIN